METKTYTGTLSRAHWPSGAWDAEPADKMQWPDLATGLPCLAVRNPLGAWCGYVGVPPGHRHHGASYHDVGVDVHGDLTFADRCQPEPEEQGVCHVAGPGEPDDVWWLGFDCSHYGDVVPSMVAFGGSGGVYRTLDYVRAQCASLAEQLAAQSGSEL